LSQAARAARSNFSSRFAIDWPICVHQRGSKQLVPSQRIIKRTRQNDAPCPAYFLRSGFSFGL
jgi:hypothetical protein